jgi:hypothetical protein
MSIRLSLLLSVVLLPACSGKTLYHSFTGVAPDVLPDTAYACTRRTLESMGFKTWRTNPQTLEYIGRRNAAQPRQSNVLARRWFDQLELQVTADSAGGTLVSSRASSYLETETQRGPTQEQQSVAKAAKNAADSLYARCGFRQT